MAIPRILHQIWVGPDPLPDDLAEYREGWIRNHPDWEHRLWTEDNLPRDFVRKEAYELLRRPAERADVIRIELLFRHGGVYVDSTSSPSGRSTPCSRRDFPDGYRKPTPPNNAIMGSVPGHPLLADAIRRIRPRTTYGPVEKARHRARSSGGSSSAATRRSTILDQPVFYPWSAAELEEAYAVHHQARTWQDPQTLAKRLVGTERLLREAGTRSTR